MHSGAPDRTLAEPAAALDDTERSIRGMTSAINVVAICAFVVTVTMSPATVTLGVCDKRRAATLATLLA